MAGDNDVWLGQLDKANNLYSHFKPVARFTGSSWDSVSEPERRKAFNKGVVYGEKNAASHQRVGTYWLFRCHVESGSDRWVAKDPERALPMLNLSKGSMAQARRTLCETGVVLPEGNGNSAVALLPEGYCALLKFELRQGKWYVKLPTDGSVELRPVDQSWLGIGVDGGPPFLPGKLAEVVTRVTWVSDGDFLASVVDRYRGALSSYLAMIRGTDAPHRRLHRALHEANLTASSAEELQLFVERLRVEWSDTARSLEALGSMTALLIDTDEGKRLLETAIEHRTREVISSMESKLKSEISIRLAGREKELVELNEKLGDVSRDLKLGTGALEALHRDREKANADIKQVKEDVGAAQTLLDERQRDLDEVEARIADLLRERALIEEGNSAADSKLQALRASLVNFSDGARRVFEVAGGADHEAVGALATRLQALLNGGEKSVPPFLPNSLPPWALAIDNAACEIVDARQIGNRLIHEAQWAGVSSEDMLLLDAFARSGEMVLLAGPMADSCLRAYSRAVAGGVIRVHAADPSVIGLDDLWRTSPTGRPTAFALAWHRAHQVPSEVVLLCIRDLDAAPFRLWLSSLQAVLDSAQRPRNLLVIALPSARTEDAQELPPASDPARYLAALAPRPLADAARSDDIMGSAGAAPTRWLVSDPPPLSRQTLQLVAKRGRDTAAIRRALRVAAVGINTAEVMARDAAAGWADFLSEADPSSLHEALKLGLRAVASLRSTR
ncbi:hypothetical protein ROSA5918_25240 [Roseateles saccharophilus]|uniref:Uncharacterized protein n=2 Tax=Roseateles saccharophilus TaxID=304 RepID=A0A4R3V1H4_ROSSA|nr:hypothetical protein EV671_10142 [Roseateles saccharophilus]